MNVHEMEGFLRGKCLPGDLLVGESNAAYLVRKLNEAAALKADRDAQQKRADALAVENAEMRETLDSIRIYSSDTLSGPSEYTLDMVEWLREGIKHIHDLSEIYPQPLRGLGGENAALKQFIVQHCYVIKQCCGSGDDDEFEAFVSASDAMPETPATDAALAAIEARFCGLLDTYGKVEPERFNPEFADLYAKIVNRIFSSVMDNPSVTDLESLTDYLENSTENARAYADMSMKFHAELREAK